MVSFIGVMIAVFVIRIAYRSWRLSSQTYPISVSVKVEAVDDVVALLTYIGLTIWAVTLVLK